MIVLGVMTVVGLKQQFKVLGPDGLQRHLGDEKWPNAALEDLEFSLFRHPKPVRHLPQAHP